MRRLPPLTAIEAFVHVARLGSIKAAAETLALSSPALTRRIQALERYVGHALFERRHQGVTLNPDGERLLAEIAPSVDALGLAMERAGRLVRGDGTPSPNLYALGPLTRGMFWEMVAVPDIRGQALGLARLLANR